MHGTRTNSAADWIIPEYAGETPATTGGTPTLTSVLPGAGWFVVTLGIIFCGRT
jgi:hypothetical protein